MRNPPPIALRSALALAGVLAAALLLNSCGEDTPTSYPYYRIGSVEGYIYSGGEGISTRIVAQPWGHDLPAQGSITTRSDSSGWYHLELPVGLFTLEAQDADFMFSTQDDPDTVRVTPHFLRKDIHYGHAVIRIGMPAACEGQRYYLYLRWQDNHHATEDALVEDGVLVYDLPFVPPDTYHLELNGPSANRVLLPGGYYPADEGDALTISTASVTTYTCDFSSDYAVIAGRITGSWQQTVGTSPVVYACMADSTPVSGVSCGADGSFVCRVLVPRTVRVQAEINGVRSWVGEGGYQNARVFDLQPGDSISGVSLVESGIEVALEGPGNLILYHPEITVVNEEGREVSPYSSTENPIRICNLRPGRWYVHVGGSCTDRPWASRWFGGTDVFESATPIDLGAGELRRIVVTLEPGGSISGVGPPTGGYASASNHYGLFSSDGEPVCAGGYDGYGWFSDRTFRFEGLADGDYYLAAGIDYVAWWYPGTADFAAATPLTIVDHAEITGIQWPAPVLGEAGR